MILVLLGPPGAGKGTQAMRLSKVFQLEHLSSGDVLRAERKSGTDLGKRVSSYMDAGTLVPDEIIVEVILARVLKADQGSGVLLDGFPRTAAQAQQLDASLTAAGSKVDAVLSLLVPDDQIVNRITGRRSCPTCGGVYHVQSLPPKVEGVCDKDGTALVQRSDDTVEVVQQRLAAYHAQTEPLESYYRERGLLVEVDGTQDVDVVFEQSQEVVNRRLGEVGL